MLAAGVFAYKCGVDLTGCRLNSGVSCCMCCTAISSPMLRCVAIQESSNDRCRKGQERSACCRQAASLATSTCRQHSQDTWQQAGVGFLSRLVVLAGIRQVSTDDAETFG